MTAHPSRAIGYVRVSKAREEMISPELQTTAISDYCLRSHSTLLDVVQDLDTTGRNFARAGIQHVIERVEAGEANLVVVWKWSRFGRNVRDCLVNIDRLEVAGGRLVAATEDFDDTPVGRFGRGQFLLMAQFESERIGEQWKEAQARRLRNGLPYNGHPRFGYVYDKATGFTPHPVYGPILAEMYRRYLEGEAPRKIALWLNEEGIPAPRGGIWYETTAQQVMETGFAAGLLRFNTRTGPQRAQAVPQFAEGIHEPVISRKTWEAYLRRRSLASRTPGRVLGPAHFASGLLICGTCGSPMHRASGEDRVRCSATRKRVECARPAFTRLNVVEDALKAWLLEVVIDINQRAQVIEEARETRLDVRQQVKAAARDITRLDNALTRLTRQFAEGLVPAEAYIATRDQIVRDKDIATRRLDDLTTDLEQPPPQRIAPDLLNEWDDLDTQGKRDILAALISSIEVHPRGKGYKPHLVITPRWRRATRTD